jgi:hypothetical protein
MNAPEHLPLTISLTMAPDVQPLLQQSLGAVELANAFEIDCQDVALAAQEQRISFKKINAVLESKYKGYVKPAQDIIAQARLDWKPAIEANEAAYKILGDKLLTYQAEEERRAAEARREAEEAQRKARQEAEAKAAAERAKADEQARELRRKAQEAEEAQRKAIAEGNAKAAAKAAADAAKAAEQANAVVENAEAKATEAVLEAAAMPAAQVEAPAKLAGFSSRKNWGAELSSTEEAAVKAIAATLEAHPERIALLSLNMKAANAMAKALESNFNIPGLRAVNNPVAASRSK